MKRYLVALAAVFFGVALYLYLAPAPIEALGYHPPAAPSLTGVLAPNERLRRADHLGVGRFQGPEDVAVDAAGRVYGGTASGQILRTTPEGEVELFADTGGRPLGMGFAPDGHLIVADAWKGLLSIDRAGHVSVLTTEADGVPFRFTDDLDIAKDGTIYFSDASARFSQPDYLYDLMEARPHGRLLKYDPGTGRTTTLLDHLYFANGVALSQDEDFIVVNETYRYRITRYWLRGPKAGTHDLFIDNLPGFPDNVSATRDGRFWVALFTVRNPAMDRLHPYPRLKGLLARLPRALWPKPAPYGFVVEVDETGRVLSTLQDPGGSQLRQITSVKEHNGTLYMGSLYNDRIGVLPL